MVRHSLEHDNVLKYCRDREIPPGLDINTEVYEIAKGRWRGHGIGMRIGI
jgi:hypothetical protein